MTKDDWILMIREAIAKSQEPWEIVVATNTRDGGYEARLWNARSGRELRYGVPGCPLPGPDRAAAVNALASTLASH